MIIDYTSSIYKHLPAQLLHKLPNHVFRTSEFDDVIHGTPGLCYTGLCYPRIQSWEMVFELGNNMRIILVHWHGASRFPASVFGMY